MDEELLWELMVQVGPVVSVSMPKDPVSSRHRGFGFVEFRGELDAEYAIKVLNMVKVYGRSLRLSKSAADKRNLDVGANLFIGGLGDDVDEKMLYDTFCAFGGIIDTPHIVRDLDTGGTKGFGFVKYDSFEASDLAIECMNGQFLANRPIVVQYAYRKDAPGERHGSQAERILAAKAAAEGGGPTPRGDIMGGTKLQPHTMFAAAPGEVTVVRSNARMVGSRPPPSAAPRPPPMPGMYGGMTGGYLPPVPPPHQQFPPQAGMPYGMMPPPLPSGAPPPRPPPIPAWMAAGVAPAAGSRVPPSMAGVGMPAPPPMPGMPPPPTAPVSS